MCQTGEPIKCGDKVRLEHSTTGRNLHSHSPYRSPLTQQQEVSAFGSHGDGDGGDDWTIECPNGQIGDLIFGKTWFTLEHVDTKKWLGTDRRN